MIVVEAALGEIAVRGVDKSWCGKTIFDSHQLYKPCEVTTLMIVTMTVIEKQLQLALDNSCVGNSMWNLRHLA